MDVSAYLKRSRYCPDEVLEDEGDTSRALVAIKEAINSGSEGLTALKVLANLSRCEGVKRYKEAFTSLLEGCAPSLDLMMTQTDGGDGVGEARILLSLITLRLWGFQKPFLDHLPSLCDYNNRTYMSVIMALITRSITLEDGDRVLNACMYSLFRLTIPQSHFTPEDETKEYSMDQFQVRVDDCVSYIVSKRVIPCILDSLEDRFHFSSLPSGTPAGRPSSDVTTLSEMDVKSLLWFVKFLDNTMRLCTSHIAMVHIVRVNQVTWRVVFPFLLRVLRGGPGEIEEMKSFSNRICIILEALVNLTFRDESVVPPGSLEEVTSYPSEYFTTKGQALLALLLVNLNALENDGSLLETMISPLSVTQRFLVLHLLEHYQTVSVSRDFSSYRQALAIMKSSTESGASNSTEVREIIIRRWLSAARSKLKLSLPPHPQEEKKGDSLQLVNEVPVEYLCGINHHIMKEPVRTPRGHCFEKETILSWLSQTGGMCPITGCPLTPRQLKLDTKLAVDITAWYISSILKANEDVDFNKDEILYEF